MLSEAFLNKAERFINSSGCMLIAACVADYLYIREEEKYANQSVLVRSPMFCGIKQGLIISFFVFYCGTVIMAA